MLPVYQSQLLELAAIVTDGDDIGLQLFGKSLIGNPPRIVEDFVEKKEDLLVVVPVEVKRQLMEAFLFFLLLAKGLTSRPTSVIFFKLLLQLENQTRQCHTLLVEPMVQHVPLQITFLHSIFLPEYCHPVFKYDPSFHLILQLSL